MYFSYKLKCLLVIFVATQSIWNLHLSPDNLIEQFFLHDIMRNSEISWKTEIEHWPKIPRNNLIIDIVFDNNLNV